MSESAYFNYQDEFGNYNTVEWNTPGLTVVIDSVGTVATPGLPEAPLDDNIYGRQNAAWQVIPATTLVRASPLLISLADVSIPANSTWVQVIPPTQFPLPSRTGNTLIQVGINAHVTWSANSGSQSLLDWTIDNGSHFQRSLHSMVQKQDDSTVNGFDGVFWTTVTGTAPTVIMMVRQTVGSGGMTIIGAGNVTWPALSSTVAIFDMGPL
jgi:hypothetical protein